MKLVYKIGALSVVALLVVSFSYRPAVDGGEGKKELKWRTWNDGYAELKKEGKIGLVDVYTDWCGWCKRMDRDTYEDKGIVKQIKRDFIPIKFNPEAEGIYYIDNNAYSGPQLYYMLANNQRSGFPTTFFLIPKGGVMYVERIPGYQGPDAFEGILNKIVAYAQQSQQPSVPPTPANNR